MITIIVWMTLTLFGSTHSVSFECKYISSDWGKWSTLGTIYYCDVQNTISITSPNAAQVDSISGQHLTGFHNDNVEAIQILTKGQIHYFPRGINKAFQNLKGIRIERNGLKEIHQNDLKDYPKLVQLWLYNNNLEIIEKNLFEFNPNIEWISLWSNKITHIDPNVFDKLTKFKTLYLMSNTCINMKAENNPTEVQNVITTAQAHCTNSDYSNLEQKVKNLEMDSKNLNSENLKEKLEVLENEIKNSKFSNFFQENLKDLKAALVEKKKLEFLDAISTIVKNNSIEMCSALELKVSGFEEKMAKISDAIEEINNNYKDLNKRFTNLMNALENAFSAGHQGT